MSKQYLVTMTHKVTTTYIVPADSEDEARKKIEGHLPDDGIETLREVGEYLGGIISIEEKT